MSGRKKSVPRNFIAGELCLDFVNTVDWRGSEAPHDRLQSYADFVQWAREADLVSPAGGKALRKAAAADPDRAERVLADARLLREAVHDVVSAWMDGKTPPRQGVKRLNAALAQAPSRGALAWRESGFQWKTRGPRDELRQPLAPIAWSAADLLMEALPSQVKRCADARCAWLFRDTSRGRTRRWCSMEDCGNRAKVRRHYRRHMGG